MMVVFTTPDNTMSLDSSTRSLHLQRVRHFFAASPPISQETVEIVLRSYLHIPEFLIAEALLEVQRCHNTLQAA